MNYLVIKYKLWKYWKDNLVVLWWFSFMLFIGGPSIIMIIQRKSGLRLRFLRMKRIKYSDPLVYALAWFVFSPFNRILSMTALYIDMDMLLVIQFQWVELNLDYNSCKSHKYSFTSLTNPWRAVKRPVYFLVFSFRRMHYSCEYIWWCHFNQNPT